MVKEHRGYRVADHVSWVVEQRGILLIDSSANRYMSLSYPAAAIWDLLTRGVAEQRLLRMLAVIEDVDKQKAETILKNCLEKLERDNWLLGEEVP